MEKRWWAARDVDGYCNLYCGEKPFCCSEGAWREREDCELMDCGEGDTLESLALLACRDVLPGQCRELSRFEPMLGIVEYVAEPQSLLEAAINWRQACWTEKDIESYMASKLSTMQTAVALVDAIDREMAKTKQPPSDDPFSTGPNGAVDPRRVEHPQLGS